MAWDTGLVGRALEIARCQHNPLRVMAGPGTGKSFAMKRRVARLLEEQVNPRRILAVTFTRNAAASLVSDLHNLGVDGCKDIRCGTLHSFCFHLLGQADVFGYLSRVPRPLVTFSSHACLRFEAEPMIEDISASGQFGGKRECAKRIRAFEAAWARLQSEEPGWALTNVDQAFQIALADWLVFHESMLIGELIPEALRYLRANPGCAALTAYDHVIVDEYQDLNKAEQVVLDLLSAHGNQAIVGDVDQSIYSFRYANPEGIMQFNVERPATHDEPLDECRRCPQRVVRLADHLIRRNYPAGAPPRLRPMTSNPEGEIHIVQWSNLATEAAGLAAFVRSLVDRGHAPGEILILCPRRLIGYGIRDAIQKQKLPVHSFYHEEALEEAEAQAAFNLLTLAVNPDDRVALRWWLGAGSPSWRRAQYEVLRAHCAESGESPRGALRRLAEGSFTLMRTGELVRRYAELQTVLDDLNGKPLNEIVNTLFPAGRVWASGLREAATIALEDAADLGELRERVVSAVTQPELPASGDFVRVMSLHKSKGLTNQTVIVAGCIEGLIPFVDPDEPQSKQQELLREQRRLFYVALTRCTERLILSSVSHIHKKIAYKIGARVRRNESTVASRFLQELGPEQPPARRGL